MSDMSFSAYPIIPQNKIGWLLTDLPSGAMSLLQDYIEEAQKYPINYKSKLAGNISKSILLKDTDNYFFKTILNPHIDKFVKCYPEYIDENSYGLSIVAGESSAFCLDKMWVNFQHENQFNPMHKHGGLFSFVIWVKIPTNWQEQHALPITADSNVKKTSNFEFQYQTMLGKMTQYSYYLDEGAEGKMLFFPSELMHTVYPFYNCDKERISISGNISFDTSSFVGKAPSE